MPGGPHAEEFRERRELPCRRDPADVRDMDADEVDQAILDHGDVLALADVQLAHGQGRAGLGPEQAVVLLVLRREHVLEEEQPVGLEVLGELDGHDRWHPLVNVVEQLDIVAQALPEGLEHPRHEAAVGPRLPRVLAMSSRSTVEGPAPSASALPRP